MAKRKTLQQAVLGADEWHQAIAETQRELGFDPAWSVEEKVAWLWGLGDEPIATILRAATKSLMRFGLLGVGWLGLWLESFSIRDAISAYSWKLQDMATAIRTAALSEEQRTDLVLRMRDRDLGLRALGFYDTLQAEEVPLQRSRLFLKEKDTPPRAARSAARLHI